METPSKKEKLSHKVGDKIERAGEKISRNGSPKLGKVIYDAGNKIEHVQDKKSRPDPV